MRIFFSWALGLIRRWPTRLVGAMIGVALSLALLACLGSFVDWSARTMTRRALSGLPLDWQIRFNSSADETKVRAAVQETDPNAVMEVAGYAEVPSLLAKTGQTVQTTGAAVVLGFDENYAGSFPAELAPMIGAREGILAQQQTAANLNISVGDSVMVQRAGGLSPIELPVQGIVNLPDAVALFQKSVGSVGQPPEAPPDNVLVVPLRSWRDLFLEQLVRRPDSVHFEVHVRTDRTELPSSPETAYDWELRRANHLSLQLAGHGVLRDNLGEKLASVRADALYARILVLFLGFPGLVVAALLTLTIANSGAGRRRQQQALLRARGASVATVLKLASVEAVLTGLGGCVLGAGVVLAVSVMLKRIFGLSMFGLTRWVIYAGCAALVLAIFAVLTPVWREARHSSVMSGRALLQPSNGQPIWRRLWLDVVLLAVSGIGLWWLAKSGYELVLAPEGGSSFAVHYEAFASPFCLWIGTTLAALRFFGILVERGWPAAAKLRLPLFSGKLSRIVASSLARQRSVLARSMCMVALAISFAVSTAIFNATYQTQARVDAELTNGADVTVSGVSSATTASDILSKLEKSFGLSAARVLQHGYAYVGTDLQDLYAIDPRTIGDATHLADAYFAGHDAQAALKTLIDQPDGILASDETTNDFQLNPGDNLKIGLAQSHGKERQDLLFRFVGVVREFPTAPKDSFLVVNSAYLLSHAQAGLTWTILIRSKVDPPVLAKEVERAVGNIPGVRVSDIVSTQRQISSSLIAVDLRGLTLLEINFALAFVVGATGLSLFLSLAERRRSFAILSALGAKRRHLAAFLWSEAATMLIGGGLAGACIGGIMAYALIKVLAGVFDPPPEGLTIPWLYLVLLFVSAIGLTTAVVAAHLQDLQSKSVVGELRSGV
jgi:putative ABC transport system permease protein